jgi:quinol-cytochrome oxidoreductase complex cytochrome b subunit
MSTVKIFQRIFDWMDERAKLHQYVKKNILDKPVPQGINFTFCFGGISFFLYVMLAVTGYSMTIYYVPSPGQAYNTVDYITHEIPMGSIIRNVHYWSANLLIATLSLHMLRVFVYGAYKKPREINWMTGVLLLMLILASGFTGSLLPWDQKAYWATKVGTSIMGTVPFAGQYLLKITRGGTDLGAMTLVRFYALHVMFLPLATVMLLVGHFFMIRRHGVSVPL